MDNELENQKLELRKLERALIDTEVASMLLRYGQEILDSIGSGKSVDENKHARRIVAFLREHLVK